MWLISLIFSLALQILGVHHTPLFELLGRSSGRSIDKIAQLKQQGQELEEYRGWVILKDCIGVIHLKVASETMQLGDHDLVICSVLDSQPREARKQPLYTDDLRNLGLI